MKRLIGALISGVLFAGLIVLLKTYDVAAIGPNGTSIGFSHINQMVHDLTGVNMFWYDLTEFFGYLAIAVCAVFALVGLVQMIRRRSLFKVDREILALGGLFIAVIGCYVLFEKVIINYRPVIMPGETAPEASFPSSHTMLIMTVMIAVMIISDRYVSKGLGALVRIGCFFVALVTVGGRLWCGVHWFTDIFGGILLSSALLFLFAAVITAGSKKTETAAAELYGFDRKSSRRKKAKPESMRGYKPKH